MSRCARTWLAIAALIGLVVVALGAIGAHGLKSLIEQDPRGPEWWRTAVLYGAWHGLALGLVALLADRRTSRALSVAGWGFALGVLLFSGSLFALALTRVMTFAHVTPFGGLAFMVGWVALAVHALAGGREAA